MSDPNGEEYDVDSMRAMEAHTKDNKSSQNSSNIVITVMDYIFGFLVAIVTGFFIYWSFSPSGNILFAWHPTLMAVGFIFFMTEAISVYNSAILLGQGGQLYSNRVLAHWVLHSIAMVCIVGGFSAIVYNKIRLGKHHFQSTHAIVGLITYIFMFLVAVGGIAAKYSFQLRRRVRPVLLKVTHSLFGLVIYWMGAVSIILGVYTKWFERSRSSSDTYFAVASIIAIALYSSWRPLGLAINRLRQMCTSI